MADQPPPSRGRSRLQLLAAMLAVSLLSGAVGWYAGRRSVPIPESSAATRTTFRLPPAASPSDGGAAVLDSDASNERRDQSTAVSPSGDIAADLSQDAPRAAHVADPANIERRLLESVRYLASDELEGRGVRTQGIDLAADYIANEFAAAGLKTDLWDGGPFHIFYLTESVGLGPANEVAFVTGGGSPAPLTMHVDFTPLSISSSGSFDLPLVFAGYGVSDPQSGYDDFAEFDVRGKAVILLRYEPQRTNPDSPLDGIRDTEHSYIATKVRNAVERGARAVILCTADSELRRRAAEHPDASRDALDLLIEWRDRPAVEERQIPVIHCRRAIIEKLLSEAAGRDLAQIEREIDADFHPRSFELGNVRVRGSVSVAPRGKPLKNVAGLLAGDGSIADETVVVGAHYDHLGWGGWGSLAMTAGDEIHNGADDNASGTAVMIEVARLLAARDVPLRRRVLFLAFSAEELGLVGSKRYVRDPLIPIDHTVAMVNLDMVGRLRDDRLTAYGTGTAHGFSGLIEALGRRHQLTIGQRPGGYGPSDHASFYARGVPVLHFFTGFHPEYHRPGDDVETLNIAGMRRIALLTADLVEAIANADSSSLTPTGPGRRLSGGGEDRLLTGAASRGTAAAEKTAYLGIRAIQVPGVEGLQVEQIAGGSPAAQSGLRAGDVITQLGREPLASPADLIAAVQKHRPGERIVLRVQRGMLELEFEIALGAR